MFWEQQGLQTFGQRIQITRPQASQPAFERHFIHLTEEYGSVHAINLLGTKENEASLTAAYARHLQIARNTLGDAIGISHFDFHNAVRLYGHDGVLREVRYVDNKLNCSLNQISNAGDKRASWTRLRHLASRWWMPPLTMS